MPENTTTVVHTITDRDGDRLTASRGRDGLYVTVGHPAKDQTLTAGPFTPALLRSAIAEVHPTGDALQRDLETMREARDKAQAELSRKARRLEVMTRERDLAVETVKARTQERDRAREDREELQERLAIQQQMATEAPQPRTVESVTDREVETVMRAMGWWQEGKRIGQYPVNLVRSARRTVVALANMPVQEQAEVDAIKAWLTTCTSPTTLARELYARGFTAPEPTR